MSLEDTRHHRPEPALIGNPTQPGTGANAAAAHRSPVLPESIWTICVRRASAGYDHAVLAELIAQRWRGYHRFVDTLSIGSDSDHEATEAHAVQSAVRRGHPLRTGDG